MTKNVNTCSVCGDPVAPETAWCPRCHRIASSAGWRMVAWIVISMGLIAAVGWLCITSSSLLREPPALLQGQAK